MKLKITGYTNKLFSKKYTDVGSYSVMMNPESIKLTKGSEYSTKAAPNAGENSPKFKNSKKGQLSFDIVIDCTGVVNPQRVDMAEEISKIEKLTHKYNGKIHRPNYVIVRWGKDLTFKGVLSQMDISYTLFKPNGAPLRAKVSLTFDEYIAPKRASKMRKKSSPDLTHLVEVNEGDTLPQLCDKVWEDYSYYIQAAKFNKLNKFRNLSGGTQLVFPPITQPS
ncbi:hypothetical protein [Reichenbachiella sp.]|uniref:CIS tube protein n=1 Tax=Reichenbachiella sp. TaxID=2184521 RepID=UPI003BAFE08D